MCPHGLDFTVCGAVGILGSLCFEALVKGSVSMRKIICNRSRNVP